MATRSVAPAFPGVAFPALAARTARALVLLQRMHRAIETRRTLAALDDRMLKDIGIGRAEALAEAGRAPWDLGEAVRR